ncbi:MtrB/PioB family outer membrane beta-barrel protein [Pleionea sediminis]|uniref:MtrB/PioB family outer membrane beta-barrel protein n=1 Tax=Pleionea sediminis TaxID=2569479 RepID=UPI0013DE44E4|nr:MtrB/PioB family outer membrane beta-barrel protein [Pleionea sediminis]
MDRQCFSSTQPLLKLIALVTLFSAENNSVANDKNTDLLPEMLEFENCEFCNQFTESYLRYYAGLSWLNGHYLKNHRELNYQEPFDFSFGFESQHWNNNLLLLFNIDYLNENNQELSFSFEKPGLYHFQLYQNARLWHTGNSQISLFTQHNGYNAALPDGWQPIASTDDLTSSTINFQNFEPSNELLRQGIRFDYSPTHPWKSGVKLSSDNYKSQQLHAGSILTASTFFPLQKDFTNDQLTAYLAYQTEKWQLKSSYHLSLLQNKYTTTFWENPFVSINNNYTEIPHSQLPDNKFHQISLSYVNQLTSSQRLHLNGAWGKGSQDDYFAQPFNPLQGYETALPQETANLKVNTSNIKINYSNRVKNNIKLNYRYLLDERQSKHYLLTEHLWSSSNTANDTEFNVIYPRVLDYKKQNHLFNLNWRINKMMYLSYKSKWKNYDQLKDSIKSDEAKHAFRLNIFPTENYDISLSAGRANREGSISRYYWSADTSFEERNILSRFHANKYNRVEWHINNNWLINHKSAVMIDYKNQWDRYPKSPYGIQSAKHSIAHIEYQHTLNNSTHSSFYIDRELSRSNQIGGIQDDTLPWSSEYRDYIVTFGINLSYQPNPSEWQYKLAILNSQFYGDQHTQSVLNEEPFPTIRREQTKIKFEPIYQLNPITTLNMLYQYERLNNRDWQQDLLVIDEVPKLIPPTLIAPNYNLHFFSIKVVITP